MASQITGNSNICLIANNKETTKIRITGPLLGKSAGDQWIPS